MRSAGFALGFVALALTGAAAACNGNTSPPRDDSPPSVSTSTTIRPSVAWPAANAVDDRALQSLITGATAARGTDAREIRALVSRSPVPVLAPRSLELTSPTLVVEGEYFALSGRLEGVTISLQGTRAAHRYEGIEPAPGNRELRGTRGFVSINEGIRTASWIENGAAYTADVECADVHDARCESEAFLLQLVGQLAFVGGSGR